MGSDGSRCGYGIGIGMRVGDTHAKLKGRRRMHPTAKFSVLVLLSTTDVWSYTSKIGHGSSLRRHCCLQHNVNEDVSVYENVLKDTNIRYVDGHARLGGLGHSCMDRSLKDCRSNESAAATAVEAAIEVCLHALNDQSRYVEYWWRDEWISLEAHRDIDEMFARSHDGKSTIKEKIRYPKNAHVLYLDVGEDVCGPTIVIHDDTEDDESDDDSRRSFTRCTVVHAKQNRLLRFKGDMIHAVPRPQLCYFNPEVGGSNTMIWTRTKRDTVPRPERRSVLLFNTWDELPPFNVPIEPPAGSLKAAEDGIKEWWCSKGEFKQVNIEDHGVHTAEDRIELTRMKIGLLGDIVRRGRADRYLELQGDLRLTRVFNDKSTGPVCYRVFDFS